MINDKVCDCGSLQTYSSCCGRVYRAHENAVTAEQLMRSRYTAFTRANGNFLIATHHKTTRKPREKHEISAWAKSVQWLRLEVLHCKNGRQEDVEGSVMFKAYFYENGGVQVIQENSFFRKENNCWFYVGPIQK